MKEGMLRFMEKIEVKGPCHIWKGMNRPEGGGVFVVSGSRLSAARASWFYAFGELPPTERLVRHSCGNSACVNPEHLYLAQPKTPVMGTAKDGRLGENHPYAKLADADVEIIIALKGRFSARELAEKYGVHVQTIYKLWQGKARLQARRNHVGNSNSEKQPPVLSAAHFSHGPFGERKVDLERLRERSRG